MGSAVASACASSPCVAFAPSARRTFFGLPDLSKLGPSSSKTGSRAGEQQGQEGRPDGAQTFHETKDFKYSPEELYNIVADVDSYSEFLPNCLDSRVLGPANPPHPTLAPRTVRLSAEETQSLRRLGKAVRADLAVGFKAFKEAYTSRVEMLPPRYVTATADTAKNPLFRHLYTEWSFHPTTSAASSIPLSLFNTGSSSSPASSSVPSATLTSKQPNPHRTRLEFTLEYAFRNPLYGMVASQAFDLMANRMMHAFEERATKLYGRR
ncbi:hypothetical protein OC844_002940 [Tilletia horrida]|nr:hypothetical protein OC844_002940 [Tilletia horrida]